VVDRKPAKGNEDDPWWPKMRPDCPQNSCEMPLEQLGYHGGLAGRAGTDTKAFTGIPGNRQQRRPVHNLPIDGNGPSWPVLMKRAGELAKAPSQSMKADGLRVVYMVRFYTDRTHRWPSTDFPQLNKRGFHPENRSPVNSAGRRKVRKVLSERSLVISPPPGPPAVPGRAAQPRPELRDYTYSRAILPNARSDAPVPIPRRRKRPVPSEGA